MNYQGLSDAERVAYLEAQVREAHEQLEHARLSEKYKEQFLANMSHEIRTPMHAISGITNILKRNKHLPEQAQYLDAISQSIDNLLVIVNDILDLSKIEAGKIKIDSIPMNPTKIIEGVTEMLKFKADHNDLYFETNISDEIPEYVIGDPVRLNQILVNLVGNGIKFTEKGGITISLALDELDGEAVLKFAVKDTGIGIVDDRQDSIFGEYEQIDDEHGKQYAGTGLGLSVTKQLVELQNGTIWVESKTLEGSTFFFTMPFISVERPIEKDLFISEEELLEICTSLQGIKILLAEDNEFNIMVALDDLNYYLDDIQIETAKTGDQAVYKYKNGTYDIILMDIQMPTMNGLDATQAIREYEAENKIEKPIPVIAMTASLLRSEIMQCFDAGMNNFVPKPYKIEELMMAIFTEARKSGFC